MGSHGHDEPASEVLTDSFPQTVLGHCENRADEWAFKVKGQISILGKISMLQIVFIMHNVAQTLELGETSLSKLEQDQQQNERLSRPENEDQQAAFLKNVNIYKDIMTRLLT